ncbi:putative undecaprenyl-diphosphatase YbjG [mine drainage metagenome]|uniref:Putative undecaprenyl-diphosphatase YbjG n=1 Tax=mine drainage metagenome TaxID=410659 RepID=A0A1J5Q6Y7_9ZZZZ
MHLQPSRVTLTMSADLVPVAWARIYLGVHFPMDIAGAALVAVSSAYLCFREERWFLDSLYRWTSVIYRQPFALPISRGWVRV